MVMIFSQETLDMIKRVANVLELNFDDNDITMLTKTINLEAEMLKSKVLSPTIYHKAIKKM